MDAIITFIENIFDLFVNGFNGFAEAVEGLFDGLVAGSK